jgi:DNA-binding protein YbaB
MSPTEPGRPAGAEPSELDELEKQIRTLRDALEDTTCTAETADGLIEATVTGRGQLVGLRLDPRIYRSQDCEVLASDILDAVRRASEQAQAKVAGAAGPLLVPADVPPELVDAEVDTFLHHLNRLMGQES